jgi:hypothetical protein
MGRLYWWIENGQGKPHLEGWRVDHRKVRAHFQIDRFWSYRELRLLVTGTSSATRLIGQSKLTNMR